MSKKPNILFIMTDQQRHDAIGYRNPEVLTPHLDRLAAESVVFTNGYTSNPSCIPARAAIFTGRYPSQCGAPTYMTPLPDYEQTFMSILRDNGYHTAVIGKQHFWKTKVDKGYDYMDIVDEHFPPKVISKELDEREFGLPQHLTVSDRVSSYVSFLADSGFTEGAQLFEKVGATKEVYRWKVEEKYHIDAYVGNRGVEWIQNSRPSEPWFLTLSFPGPHTPFDGIGLPDEALYDESKLSLPTTEPEDIFKKPGHFQSLLRRYCEIDPEAKKIVSRMSDDELRLMRKSYYANVTLIDRKVGEVVEALKSAGEYDNTMIIYLSDHGDFMGDFGMAQKMQCVSEQLMRIPYFIKPPVAGFEGYREESFVSSVEVAATCLTAGGIEVPGNMSPRSLTQFFDKDGEPERWEDIYLEARDIRGIRSKQYKLVYYAEREYGELYDLLNDPEERDNLWSREDLQSVKQELMKRLMDRIIQIGQNVHVIWHPSVPAI
ncbi:sulfatase [Paenibacillus sp. YYML68]|uniref:sulfatase family protein n=1 Tax=Paenibacillus sp. YYML68 TaxID=2909250 RepID=UPI002493CB04|nr:sulfatase-like hydrolase/transferase [Paenibacillus sp. YYML68]